MGAPALQTTSEQILITEGLSALDVISRAANEGVQNLIQKDGVCFESEQKLAELMVQKPEDFFKSPLESIVGEPLDCGRLFEFTCEASENKRELVKGLEDFLLANGRAKSVRDEVILAADEIFTNASKNSGVFYNKMNELKAHPAPAVMQALSGSIRFSAYVDASRVVLVCEDTFGGLVIPKLVAKIRNCYEVGVAESIQQGNAGAGIGSFLIFNSCSSYYLGVKRGKKTVVGVSFQHTPRAVDKSAISKNINFVSIE